MEKQGSRWLLDLLLLSYTCSQALEASCPGECTHRQPCHLISSTHCSVEAPDNSFGLVIRGANGSKSCGSLPARLSVSLSAWPAHSPAPLGPAHASGSIWRRCNCLETIVPSLDPSPKWHLQGNERAELTASPWSQRLLLITDEESLQLPSP